MTIKEDVISTKLQLLENAGVDNWDGYGLAIDQYLEEGLTVEDLTEEMMLEALENGGVDNWSWYSEALDGFGQWEDYVYDSEDAGKPYKNFWDWESSIKDAVVPKVEEDGRFLSGKPVHRSETPKVVVNTEDERAKDVKYYGTLACPNIKVVMVVLEELGLNVENYYKTIHLVVKDKKLSTLYNKVMMSTKKETVKQLGKSFTGEELFKEWHKLYITKLYKMGVLKDVVSSYMDANLYK